MSQSSVSRGAWRRMPARIMPAMTAAKAVTEVGAEAQLQHRDHFAGFSKRDQQQSAGEGVRQGHIC